jgi:hypothetical protein
MENGGFDKPGCTGGFDADRDGNNGCGNDADREDDNNGNCGGGRGRENNRTRPTSSSTTTTSTTGPVIVEGQISASSAGTGSVAGSSTDVAVAGAGQTATPGDSADTVGTEVLGETIERPSALPRTGAGVVGLTLLGGLLCGGGRAAVLARRLLRIG